MVAPMNRKWNWSRGYLLLGSLLMPLCGAMPAEAQDCGIAGGSNLVIMLPVTSTRFGTVAACRKGATWTVERNAPLWTVSFCEHQRVRPQCQARVG